VGERETVFGGEGRLRETIAHSLKVIDEDLYIVLSGYTTEIVGDDIKKVVAEFQNAGDALAYSKFLVNDFGLVPETQYITDATPDGHLIHQAIRDTDWFGPPLLLGASSRRNSRWNWRATFCRFRYRSRRSSSSTVPTQGSTAA